VQAPDPLGRLLHAAAQAAEAEGDELVSRWLRRLLAGEAAAGPTPGKGET
jgi:hypothetical protein